MKKKVIAAGHICLDITPVFPDKKVSRLSEILSPGRLIQMGEADVHTGGAVANTGLAMKILGADVTLMGKIGTDAFGEMVCNILRQHDAEKGMILSDQESTSYSVILAVPGIDRIFLHNPGANHSFRASDIPQKALEEAALFHFGYPPLMKSMYEHDGEELVEIMKRAKAAGAATSLDMAAVDPDAEAGTADWEKILERVMPYVDFFVPSVEELCYMLDKKRYTEWQERAGGSDITEMLNIEKDIMPLGKQCMEFGAKALLIKCGAPGMYYKTADRRTLMNIGSRAGLDLNSWAGREGFEKSYVPERILSGTGAGDTSIAAFLTAMLEGYPLEKTLQLSAATGASCVAVYDALSGLKSFEELENKINAGWCKSAR
ncbi:sugar kinase [Faecalicatena orotica]|uniref:Sugar/nucleoside kinase (Ribokinase family) n=1 Tax=Faecalicatena orotica TaxID=1544 RepID=A0A2Y9BAX0_9FIRM|nr:carbohydrate kinase family protein [Faecalicatena orotica]PWJ30870.1 sugar/nucleoside kinase (ribokinase family) [Faecalicatena orotica]SSA55031.1 Sugar or nucleoside kinase, ribokinase family [Faecalicatena orotica]